MSGSASNANDEVPMLKVLSESCRASVRWLALSQKNVRVCAVFKQIELKHKNGSCVESEERRLC